MQEKYDRQIRLWGEAGQRDINNAIVISLGSGSVASEFLKNLVLHAVGKIIIIDDAVVTEQDLHDNFMIEPDSLGKPRADEMARLLNELNPDPQIITIHKSPNDMEALNEQTINEDAFIVTYNNQSTEFLEKLSDFVREHQARQVHIQACGFMGAIYLDCKNHYSFEGPSPNTLFWNDFRIINPFPALKEFFDSFDLEKIPIELHANLPFPVILYHARNRYIEKTGKQPEFSEFRRFIKSLERDADKENSIDTAYENSVLALNEYLPPNTESSFSIVDDFPENDPFWRLVRSAKAFYQKHGAMPHSGEIPDVETTPDLYATLKKLYREKSNEDWQEVFQGMYDIPEDFKNRFKKNIWRIKGKKYPPLKESLKQISAENDFIHDQETNDSLNAIQNVFISSRMFFTKSGKVPKLSDIDEIKTILKEIGAPQNESLNQVTEHILQFQGAALPSVVSTISAFAAEEVTKAIIRQQIPIDPVFIYNAVHGQATNPKM